MFKTKIYLLLLSLISLSSWAQNKPIRIACVGNSITYGAGLRNPGRDAYPGVLQRMLGNQYDVKNFGRSGATLLRKGNFPYWTTGQYRDAKKFNPDIVIIKLGSNDSKPVHKAIWGQFETDLANLIDTFRLLPARPKVYLCYPAPAIGIGNFGITDSVLVEVLMPQIKKVAREKKTGLIDLHRALILAPEHFPDRIHPNEAGELIMAQTVYKALTGKEFADTTKTTACPGRMSFNTRGSLNNCRLIFEKTKRGRVAFLGGSITEMNGWRSLVCKSLQERFPDTEFDFVDAGIGSTGTTPGAFRFKRDALKNGKIDLLFIDASVNDNGNEPDSIAQIRGMEGEVRQALLSNPNIDMVMLHFICDDFIPKIQAGEIPRTIANHARVAEYYNIPNIDLAKEVALRMKEGEFDWQKFGGIHPAPFGHTIYHTTIRTLLHRMWSVPNRSDKIVAHAIPDALLDPFSYFRGNLIEPTRAKIAQGWSYQSPWTPKTNGFVRPRYQNKSYLEALTPGAELTFAFNGTAIGIYCLCGPDAGIVEYSIDGAPFVPYDLYTRWSGNLYIPWVHMFATTLKPGKHKITMRMSANKNPKSTGTACQIYYFAVNGK